MQTRFVAAGILSFLVLIFVLQNTEVVSIRFLFWDFSMSRVILLFLVFVFGVGTAWVLHGLTRARSESEPTGGSTPER